jgi:hypothetical protein
MPEKRQTIGMRIFLAFEGPVSEIVQQRVHGTPNFLGTIKIYEKSHNRKRHKGQDRSVLATTGQPERFA